MHLTVMLSFILFLFFGTGLFIQVLLSLFILSFKGFLDVAMHVNAHKNDPKNLPTLSTVQPGRNHLNKPVVKTGKDGIYNDKFNKVFSVIVTIVVVALMLYTFFYFFVLMPLYFFKQIK